MNLHLLYNAFYISKTWLIAQKEINMTNGKYPLLLITVMTGAYLMVQAITGQFETVNILLWLILGIATAGIVMLKPTPPPTRIVDAREWFAQYDIDSGWDDLKSKIRG